MIVSSVGADHEWMAAEPGSTAKLEEEWVVLASFGTRQRGEYTLARLGRGFRSQARDGRVIALVVTETPMGRSSSRNLGR